jgi:DNA-binding transcriptional ArsR family regulator
MAIDTAYTPTGDVHGVVLIPSYVVRPFVFYVEHSDQMLFIYPVADRFLDAIDLGPPDRLVRLAFALGDRGRLQILTILKERDMTLKELEDRLGLPRSTLRHHIGILRGAGLLRPMQSGAGFYSYQLRQEAATDLTELVDRFLRR